MKRVINLYKPLGLTPLQTIDVFRRDYPEYENVKLGYAGRLDPMADGVLLVLVGEENKKRKYYEDLSKTYSFEILFGITTDTYDTLGIITNTHSANEGKIQQKLPQILTLLKRKTTQTYPPYSSRTVNGKPLYYWAREGKLDEITIPDHAIHIYSISLEKLQKVSSQELTENIMNTIASVNGKFRQKLILSSWDKWRSGAEETVLVATITISCSSGTYVRSICHEIGEELGTGAIALSITRTQVGAYTISDSLRLSKS